MTRLRTVVLSGGIQSQYSSIQYFLFEHRRNRLPITNRVFEPRARGILLYIIVTAIHCYGKALLEFSG